MNYKELQKRNRLVLQTTKNFKYVLYEATKEETELLYEEIKKYMEDKQYRSEKVDFLTFIDFFGETSDVNHYHVRDLIPVIKEHKFPSDNINGKPTIIPETMCYQAHGVAPHNNIILHEDKVSSFKCACQAIKTKFFIVLKEHHVMVFYGTSRVDPPSKKELEKYNEAFKETEVRSQEDISGVATTNEESN